MSSRLRSFVFFYKISPWLYFAAETLLVWQLLAVSSLRLESDLVYRGLHRGDLQQARYKLSMIVGRDTNSLNEEDIARAAVETVAENTSDGVAAPLFFIALGGAPLGSLYKAVNTMDSMIGYKNDRYSDFGRFAAITDDILNFIPSRLCAIVMILAAHLCGCDAKNAVRIWRRDRKNHASPNSAQTEAVMAGALCLRLGGDAYYSGTLVKKPYIGDASRAVQASDIRRAHRVLFVTSVLLLLLSFIVRAVLYASI